MPLITVLTHNSTHAGAQDANVRNFHIVRQDNTHITFSWDIVDGYHSSILDFTFYYRQRSNPYESISFANPPVYSTNQTNGGRTFSYTLTLQEGHTFYGPYVMWIRVHRYRISPTYTYSEQVSVTLGG